MGSSVGATVLRDEQYPDTTVPDSSYSTRLWPVPILLQYSSYSIGACYSTPARYCSTRPTGPLKAGMSQPALLLRFLFVFEPVVPDVIHFSNGRPEQAVQQRK